MNNTTREWFIQRYSDLHEDLKFLENEITYHEKNKSSLIDSDSKLIDLRRRIVETIDVLEKTRKEERKIFNYGK